MKKIFVFLFCVIGTFAAFSQSDFLPGYYISNDDEKIEGYLKDKDWKDNPDSFEFRRTEDGEIMSISIKNSKMFEIPGVTRYVRMTVKMDRSDYDLSDLGYSRNPIYNEETLFLKQLVKGDANLYEYTLGSFKRYFLQMLEGEIVPLLYKGYLTDMNDLVYNQGFRQQLYAALSPMGISLEDVSEMKYQRKPLSRIVSKYNNAAGIENTIYKVKRNGEAFSFSISPGVDYGRMVYTNGLYEYMTIELPHETSFRIGVEAEVTLPFNNNKWAIILEPSYSSYHSSIETNREEITMSYRGMDILGGLRYYMFLSKNSQLFVNVGVGYVYMMESFLDKSFGYDFKTFGVSNQSIGLGYRFMKRISVEGRYYLPNVYTGEFTNYDLSHRKISTILKITIL